jgi:lactoylglutathione lyase
MMMAKAIHMMIRVIDEARSVEFYRRAFALEISDRFDFDELTVNKGRSEPYGLGEGYGHIAFAVDDLEAEHARFASLGLAPNPIKAFHRDGSLMARFFFVQDPDGYKIEVLQRHGRYG